VFPLAPGCAHLCTSGSDAHFDGSLDSRSSVGHRRPDAGWTDVHAVPGPFVQRARCRALFADAFAQEPRQTAGDLGGAPIHRSHVVKDFLSAGGAKRIHLERLPAYAPELNPQEGGGNLLKRRELKNLGVQNLPPLALEVRRATERLRHRKTTLVQCVAHAGFPL